MAGRLDSNQRMAGSKPAALPWRRPKFDAVLRWQGWIRTNGWRDQNPLPTTGDAPNTIIITGGKWRGWIRTNGWRDQNPLPYHLATPLTLQL